MLSLNRKKEMNARTSFGNIAFSQSAIFWELKPERYGLALLFIDCVPILACVCVPGCAGDDRQPGQGWHQDLGADGGQTGDRHQHRSVGRTHAQLQSTSWHSSGHFILYFRLSILDGFFGNQS